MPRVGAFEAASSSVCGTNGTWEVLELSRQGCINSAGQIAAHYFSKLATRWS
jgi:hypothetical protein